MPGHGWCWATVHNSALAQHAIMKVVITGGCGFLGQRVAQSLISKATFCGSKISTVTLVGTSASFLWPW